jgi:sulfotransferase
MNIHFIAGLPRSGSTVLAAILRQNPAFRAAVSSPLYGLCMASIREMGAATEYASFFSDDTRRRILAALFRAYHDPEPGQCVFDTSRLWSGKLPLLAALFPAARTVCCVRDPRWVLDSAERIHRRNPLQSAALFEHNPNTSVQLRAASMMDPAMGFIGAAWSALREGWYGEQAASMIVLRYETLVATPQAAIAALYAALGEPAFAHDFASLSYGEPAYDARLGMPGLHNVAGPVHADARATILPPDLFAKYANLQFWLAPGGNPRGVTVI